PGVAAVFGRGGGDTSSARYCYSVWLRHLVVAAANGFKVPPRVVAELGPGDSLGLGLSMLLSGADRYHAFDVVQHAQVKRNQAVLGHVDDLASSYRAMRLSIKPDGLLSHTIDFRCHSTARVWHGHWRYSDAVWKLIRGRRSYLLNREPYSAHLRLLAANGFA